MLYRAFVRILIPGGLKLIDNLFMSWFLIFKIPGGWKGLGTFQLEVEKFSIMCSNLFTWCINQFQNYSYDFFEPVRLFSRKQAIKNKNQTNKTCAGSLDAPVTLGELELEKQRQIQNYSLESRTPLKVLAKYTFLSLSASDELAD